MPLTPPVSALARQTIRTAYENLERTITPTDSRDFRLKTLQDVRVAALEIEKQLAARQSLRNMRRLMPLFRGLEHYSKVVDVLCNGTPYLPWIWAPITLILRVASEYVEAFEQVIKGYSRIAASLGRFEILSDAFIGHQDFQQTLAVFYADILQFHKHAYKFVRRSGWKLLFLTSWGRFQTRFDNILENMKRHEALIDQEANARNIAEARKMRQDIRTWREESLEQVGRLEEERAAKHYQSIMSWLKMDESDQLAIFDSISVEGTKYPGTCGWTLKNPRVISWLQRKPDTPILWLQGAAGSGKSVISTQLVNFMKIAKHFIIHHFCTYSYASSMMYDQILRSLLLQLLRKDGELVAHVYEECVLGKKSPTVSALEQLLQTLFKSMSNEPCKTEYIWVILDGLDECEADKQARVVSLINQITSKPSVSGGTICKVLISSRASPVLSNRLRKKQTISLTDEKDCVERAIRQYASQRLQSLHQRLGQLHVGPSEIEDIELGITKKADGMFLYARLVMDYLSTNIFYSGNEIKTSVNKLPEKLTDFYRKILAQILIHLDHRSVDRVKCILGWISFAKRPLRKLEFLSAISFSSGNPEVTHLVPLYILDICGPLIEERRDTTLAFIHVSVKEFLQTSSSSLVINEQEALQEHGVATITCLLSGLEVFSKTYQEQTKYLRVVTGLHGFHIYATEYWTEYLLSHAVSVGDLDANSSLFVLAYRLADRLEAVSPTTAKEADSESMLDKRLISLGQHAALYKQVEAALKARSLKGLESELLQEHVQDGNPQRSSNLPGLDGISAMLTSYQAIVRSLLNQGDFPGVFAEELELFKSQFRTSAFTCRLNSCPRATLGFESEKLRLEHEIAHVRFRCTFPGCKYPLFVSAQSLRNHLNKYHNPNPPRKSIRKVGHFSRTRSGNAASLVTLQEYQQYQFPQEAESPFLLQDQTLQQDQMHNKGMSDSSSFQSQGSPMMAPGQDSGAIATYYNTKDMGGANDTRPGTGTPPSFTNHSPYDYSEQLMLEQQREQRLRDQLQLQQLREQRLRDQQQREQQQREQQQREQQQREQQQRDQQQRDQQQRDQQQREQLIILEQQERERLIMARREQDNMGGMLQEGPGGSGPNQMPNKGMPNPSGPQSQDSPMMAPGQDGGAIATHYNTGDMGGAKDMRPGTRRLPNPAGIHPLFDYETQLNLLEQQEKERLMMARREQDNVGGMPRGRQSSWPNKLNFEDYKKNKRRLAENSLDNLPDTPRPPPSP